jgi:eukaryotic-like serine/threonine-protein kinase
VPLRALLDGGAAADPEVALTALKGSLLGLGHAHRAGVVHRDYKPENVMVDSTGTSRLLDFGVAVAAGPTTWRGGTPLYMAPEAWTVGAVTPSVDVYAATAVFFECLCGHPPFSGNSAEALRRQHLSADIPLKEVPEALRDLVRRGLAKTPADRHPSAAAFLLALERAAESACGAGWEQRGQRALAVATAALAALWPLSAAGGTSGAGAVAEVGTATAGGGGTAISAGGAQVAVPVIAGVAAALLVLGGIGGGLAITGSGPFHHDTSRSRAALAPLARHPPGRGAPPSSGAPPGALGPPPLALSRPPATAGVPAAASTPSTTAGTAASSAPLPVTPPEPTPATTPPVPPAPTAGQRPPRRLLSVSLCLYNGSRPASARECVTRPTYVLGGLTCSAPPTEGCAVTLVFELDPGEAAASFSWGLIVDLSTAG